MPLARMAMYGKGVEIYLAPTADSRDRWQATLRHIALEGRCFVIGCNQFVTKEHYPADIEILGEFADWPDVLSPGGTSIYSPLGEPLAGPLLGEAGGPPGRPGPRGRGARQVRLRCRGALCAARCLRVPGERGADGGGEAVGGGGFRVTAYGPIAGFGPPQQYTIRYL